MSLILPSRQAESLRNTSDTRPLKPAGQWEGTIESAEVRTGPPINNKTGDMLKGFVGPEARRLTITIGDNKPLDGQQDVGGQKEFLDIVLEDGPYSLRETAYDDIPDEAWQLQRSARIVANLAVARGEITMADEENARVNDDFLDKLEEGDYVGETIRYAIYHRKGRDKVVRAEIEQFLA